MPRWIHYLCLSLALGVASAGCGGQSATGSPATAPGAGATPAPAVSPELMSRLQVELAHVLARRGIALNSAGRPTGKVLSSVPPCDYSTPFRFDNLVLGTSELTWNHYQRGDYDQNGEVNVADLTPVGFHFLKTSASPDWAAASVADGDGNGEVNVADITPIGQNFGALVAGYVIEAHETGADWREYGFIPLSAGFDNGAYLEFGYTAPSGTIESEFRVSPAGRPRELAWDTYVLTDAAHAYSTPVLAVVDGKPVIAFTSYNDSHTSRLGFGRAESARPAAPDEWQLDYDLLVDYFGHAPPALCVVQGEPAMAYFEDNGSSIDINYMARDTGSGVWVWHNVDTLASYQGGCKLINRQGRPVILLSFNGLGILGSQVAQPTASTDWDSIMANPTLTSFINIDALASGPWVFACGNTGALGENLACNRSNAANPNSPAGFTEYILFPGGSTFTWPSLALAGGIPCLANMNSTNAALQFFQAGSRIDDSAATWFVHDLTGGDNITGQTREPSLALLEGRPAIAAGTDPLTLYWSEAEFPEQSNEWHTQAVAIETSPVGTSLVVIDGLPVIAYGVFDNASSHSNIAIAAARER